MESVECVVVGAGVVGLAIARALALQGREVVIVEAEAQIGLGVSSRSSEVIHAGIYYPAGSLKAQFCVRGASLLYAYCASHGVAHRRCGKLIVATSEAQHEGLAALQAAAARNGVADLTPIAASQAMALEPALHCTAALMSPNTGIIDSRGFMLSLLGEAEDHGAALARSASVTSGAVTPDGIRLDFAAADFTLNARLVVNAAGLGAWEVARVIEGVRPEAVPRARFAKGSYFSTGRAAPFSRLIYPLPEPGGLGVHLTLDLGGQARFGPDVQWVDAPDYALDASRGDGFYTEIRKYWPGLQDGELAPVYAGVRPKLHGPGEPAADFRIDGPEAHGAPGLINLFGFESPGLTSSLAIAEAVAARAAEMLA